MSDEYDELKSFKIIQKMIEDNCGKLQFLQTQLEKYYDTYDMIHQNIEDLKTKEEMNCEIFSPRTESTDYDSVMNTKKNQVLEVKQKIEDSENKILLLKENNENLSFVLNVLSKIVKQIENTSFNPNSEILEKLVFCSKLCDSDPKRVKIEIQNIIQNVPRETF